MGKNMETRACVLYKQEDVRIETRPVGDVGPHQVLVRVGAGAFAVRIFTTIGKAASAPFA